MDKKRPHILPPMSFPSSQKSISPMEPLKPPSAFMALDGRLGSPIPRWHKPTPEEDVTNNRKPRGNQPGIQITLCPEADKPKDGMQGHWARELRKDPMYKEDSPSHKTAMVDPQVKKSPRLGTPAVKHSPVVEIIQGRPKAFYSEKNNFMPKKYAPLKPISRKSSAEDL